MIKVAIVDDNAFLQKAIIDKLSFFDTIRVKFTANNGIDLLEKLNDNHTIDLILMDIEMPKMNGVEAVEKVKKLYPQIKIIMLTVFDNDVHIFNSIKAGADGYFLKEVNPQDLFNGIVETLNGGAAMTPSIAMKTLKLLRNPFQIESTENQDDIQLTTREIDVLEQLSRGLKNKAIAENLFISAATVKKHIENIYRKLQTHNRIELIQKARENRLI
ncbi:response regulator [Flavobacterium difficile]|uniref:Response regulator transcription factor n=1 Tax=Flavobacterium difficile TaxID=2709659 RepID=A0ABX0I257_9FLAO|nr:response regulator transcription factor [Flavobacterium difficile]NHM00821.1 response regulator transcription factor [Flavobacterium difficile]